MGRAGVFQGKGLKNTHTRLGARSRDPTLQMLHYPRVHIEFCTGCRWNLRAAWYAQELLATFPQLGEVALAPAGSGVFRVWIQADAGADDVLLWDREGSGFPEAKELKQAVRDIIDPARPLGHVDRACADC